jgi:tetratricopeptide (TPR) repeat protein
MGTYALTKADYDAAIQYFEYARKKDPRDARVLNNLAYAYLVCENRNPERALNLANDALKFRPVNVPDADVYRSHFLHTRGLALMQLNQLDEAAANFEVALQDRSDSENILKDLIKCYEGRMEDQAEIYRRKLDEVRNSKGTEAEEDEPSAANQGQDQ